MLLGSLWHFNSKVKDNGIEVRKGVSSQLSGLNINEKSFQIIFRFLFIFLHNFYLCMILGSLVTFQKIGIIKSAFF